MESVDVITKLIGQLGFPIVVALFVLYRMNGKLERLALAIEKTSDKLESIEHYWYKYNDKVASRTPHSSS
jgi:hypothetical protein